METVSFNIDLQIITIRNEPINQISKQIKIRKGGKILINTKIFAFIFIGYNSSLLSSYSQIFWAFSGIV